MNRSGGKNAHSVDLHGLHPEQAIRRLSQALHAARVAGKPVLNVITGRGWGNKTQEPVLRRKIEAFLKGPDGRRFGAGEFRVESQGGSLRVSLGGGRKPDA